MLLSTMATSLADDRAHSIERESSGLGDRRLWVARATALPGLPARLPLAAARARAGVCRLCTQPTYCRVGMCISTSSCERARTTPTQQQKKRYNHLRLKTSPRRSKRRAQSHAHHIFPPSLAFLPPALLTTGTAVRLRAALTHPHCRLLLRCCGWRVRAARGEQSAQPQQI
jgi:hypothetical protein